MKRHNLPLGVQNFSEIINGDFYYVDKTALALQLTSKGKHYFLSRPRRFGKSLFLDTLKELFEANQPLFQGLAIHDQWDWSIKYPVLRFSFGGGSYAHPEELPESISEQLDALEQLYQVPTIYSTAAGRFKALMKQAKKQTGLPVVILVDEYDKPMLDALKTPDIARANRDFLSGFYGVVKDNDALVKFSFFTGVSKFAKVNIFSGLNHLTDITLDKRYSTLCGYTEHDLDTVFAAELPALDRNKIKEWYNGYNWLGEGVYNPYDVLKLFDTHTFKSYWFETGTPTFLIDMLYERNVSSPNLDQLTSDEELLSSFDVGHMPIEALMFQSGYLTIKSSEDLGGTVFHQLGYPNREVYQSFNNSLLQNMVQGSPQSAHRTQLYKLLQSNNLAELENLFHAFFATIPYNWYTNNTLQNYEGYYASVFYSYFAALGLALTVEDATNHGRIDMTLQFNNHIYVFEFKVVELAPQGEAIVQLREKNYADKYRGLKQPIYLIGVEFSKENRNIVGFEIENVS